MKIQKVHPIKIQLLFITLALCLISCTNQSPHSMHTTRYSLQEQINGQLLAYLHQATPQERKKAPLMIARYFIATQHYDLAQALLHNINPKTDSTHLLLSQLALNKNHLRQANQQLYQISPKNLGSNELVDYYQLRAQINLGYQKEQAAAIYWLEAFRLTQNKAEKNVLALKLANLLLKLPPKNTDSNHPYVVQARTINHFNALKTCINPSPQNTNLLSLPKCDMTQHPALKPYQTIIKQATLIQTKILTQYNKTQSWQKTAVLLPLSGPKALAGQTIRDGIVSHYLMNHSPLKHIDFYDTNQTQSLTLYQQRVDQHYHAVIGPLLKQNITSIQKEYPNLPIPMLALNYINSQSQQLYQLSLPPEQEILDLSKLAQQQGYHRALIIYSIPTMQKLYTRLKQDWLDSGRRITKAVPYTTTSPLRPLLKKALLINESQARNNNIQSLIKTPIIKNIRHRQDFDVIFLLITPDKTPQLIPLINYYYNESIPIYINSNALNSKTTLAQDLDGITFCQLPFLMPYNHKYGNLNQLIPSSSRNLKKLFALGLDAGTFSQLLLPPSPYPGATGSLTLKSTHRFVPRLDCAQYTHSQLRPIKLLHHDAI